ncbi:MAG: hypothetical protein IKQ45_03645 [Clostridia bacterium]|nr:hypothetical protein [Clostridia bacterium]
MKKLSAEFWAIVILLLAGVAACIISGTATGAIACTLIGAAGLVAFIRANRKEQ